MGIEASAGQDEGLRAQGRVGVLDPSLSGTQGAVERAGGDEEVYSVDWRNIRPEASAPGAPLRPGFAPSSQFNQYHRPDETPALAGHGARRGSGARPRQPQAA